MNLAPTISLLSTSALQNVHNSDDLIFKAFVFGILTTISAIALCNFVFFLIDYFKD